MRISQILVRTGVFALAIALCYGSAHLIADVVEKKTKKLVSSRFALEGIEWATVQTDGLQVFLDGVAPSETERLRAGSVAGKVVEASRVINQLLVEDSAQIDPPRFSMEILRSDTGISLIGLVPPDTDREQLVKDIKAATGADNITDLLETADYPYPDTWTPAVRYAIGILKTLPQTKISVDANRVAVISMAKSPSDKRRIETELARRVPDDVRLALDISAPRPVVTPFTLRLVIDEKGAHFDACSADDEEARRKIIKAGSNAGVQDRVDCELALGVPSPTWGDAAELSINALKALGGGTLTMSDADISIVSKEGVPQDHFDDVIGKLESELPDIFALHSELPVVQTGYVAIPEFVATLSPEGLVQMRGQVDSTATKTSASGLAKARFSSDSVTNSARITEDLPGNWSLRVLTAMEALTHLSNGAVTVKPDNIALVGNTGDKRSSDKISRLLTDELGETAQFTIDINYKEELDPVANLPAPDKCEGWLQATQERNKIAFEPGSAKVDKSSSDVLDEIADIFRKCGQLRMEIAGHTDSQGSEDMNLALSEERARAIVSELRNRRVLTSTLTSKGYGEAEPIADNGTAEGREANRRIEFRLYRTEPIKEEQTGLEAVESEGQADAQASSDDAATPKE